MCVCECVGLPVIRAILNHKPDSFVSPLKTDGASRSPAERFEFQVRSLQLESTNAHFLLSLSLSVSSFDGGGERGVGGVPGGWVDNSRRSLHFFERTKVAIEQRLQTERRENSCRNIRAFDIHQETRRRSFRPPGGFLICLSSSPSSSSTTKSSSPCARDMELRGPVVRQSLWGRQLVVWYTAVHRGVS